MEVFNSIINQFKDPELLLIIGCIIVALILLRVFSNFLSRHRLIKIAVIGAIILSVVFSIFWFVNNRKDFYSNNATKYVYGEVKNISSAVRKIEIKVTKSNINDKKGKNINDELVVTDIDINCKFLDDKGNEIKFEDIGFYDTVQIYVKENTIDDVSKDTLSGVKVVLKNEYKK